MISSDSSPTSRLERPSTGIPQLRLMLSGAIRTLLPSSVRMIGAGFQFLSTVMVARALGDGPGAPFFFWSSVLMTSGPIATYGLEQIALRNVPRLEREGPDAVNGFVANVRAMSLLLSVILGLGWVVYAFFTTLGQFEMWQLLPLFCQGAIALVLINGETLKGLSRPVLGSLFGHVIPVGLFCLLVALFADRLGAGEILALYTGSFFTGAVLARYAPGGVFKGRFIRWPDRETFRALLREGFPVCCVSLFGALGFIIPLAICETTQPAEEVSHLTAAFRISLLFVVFSGAIHGVFAPALSRNAELSRPLRPVMKVYGKSIAISLLTLGLPVAFGIAFPEWIMSIFGDHFRNGADELRLLVILQLLSLMMGPVAYLLLMTGHTRFLARFGVLKLGLVVLLSFLLIPRIGGTGMVVAMGIGFIGEGVIGVAYAVWKMKQKERHVAGRPIGT